MAATASSWGRQPLARKSEAIELHRIDEKAIPHREVKEPGIETPKCLSDNALGCPRTAIRAMGNETWRLVEGGENLSLWRQPVEATLRAMDN